MQYNELQGMTTKSIRMDNDLINKIQNLADKSERNFSQQVIFILKKYLEMTQD